MPMIEMRGVSKWYGDFQVLADCSTRVDRGDVVVVCGPSGSGKSTLIKTVNGLEPFQRGEVLVDGVSVGAKGTNLSRLRARVGMVFQHFELFPHLTIMANLTLAQTKVLGRTRDEAVAKGLQLLDRVGLRDQAASGAQHVHPFRLQQGHQPDERQAHQGAGVLSFQPLKEGDAQPLGFEAARALKGLFPVHVAGDLGRCQRPEMDPEGFPHHLGPSRGAVEQAQAGVKDHGLTGGARQLGQGSLPVPGLAKDLPGDTSDLIGTDDQGLGKVRRHGPGLGLRQPLHQGLRGFTGPAGLVHPGGDGDEGEAKPLQEFPAEGGGRGQHQGGMVHVSLEPILGREADRGPVRR